MDFMDKWHILMDNLMDRALKMPLTKVRDFLLYKTQKIF
jgi:hypothetical protein